MSQTVIVHFDSLKFKTGSLTECYTGFPLDIFFLAPPLLPNEKSLRHIEKNGASWCHFENESLGV